MGAISGLFEFIIEGLDPNGHTGMSLLADTITAFSEGVFDEAYDQWARNATMIPTRGTIVGQGMSIKFYAGLFHPFWILLRAGINKNADTGKPLNTRELIAGIIEAGITYTTNESGLGLGLRIPASIRNRIARAVTAFSCIPPNVTLDTFVDGLSQDIARFWKPILEDFITPGGQRGLEQVADRW